MSRLLFTILFISTAFRALLASVESDLTLGLSAAMRGSMNDVKKVRTVEQAFRNAKSEGDRVVAAYLLTFAQEKKLVAGLGPYLDFLVSNPLRDKILGDEAAQRILRLHGDDAYDRGKFSTAITDYRELEKRSSGFAKDYATLKLGWAYLNLKQPKEALHAWLATARGRQLNNENPALGPLISGVGQAFAEDKKRNLDEANQIALQAWNAEAVTYFIKGFFDGSETLHTTDEVAALVKASQPFPWKAALADYVVAQAPQKYACRNVEWLALLDSTQPLNAVPYAAVLNDCSAKESHVLVTPFFPRLALTGDAQAARIQFYLKKGMNSAACRDGVEWAIHTDRKALPAKEMAQACVLAIKTDLTLNAFFLEVLQRPESRMHLNAEDESLLFLFSSLLSEPSFKATVETKREVFQGTLAGDLLLERNIEDSNWETAKELLALYHPLPNLSANGTRLRVALTQRLPATDRSEDEIATLLKMKAVRASQEYSQALIPLAVEEKQWGVVATAMDDESLALPKNTKSQVLEALFAAAAETQFEPGQQLKSAELSSLMQLAVSGPAEEPVGSSRMAQDARFLLATQKRAADSLKHAAKSKDGARALSGLMNRLRVENRSIKNRKWSHEQFVVWAGDTLSEFCLEASNEAERRSDGDADWAAAVSGVKQKFDECTALKPGGHS